MYEMIFASHMLASRLGPNQAIPMPSVCACCRPARSPANPEPPVPRARAQQRAKVNPARAKGKERAKGTGDIYFPAEPDGHSKN